MKLNLIDIVSGLEEHEPLHLARLLILIKAFQSDEGHAIDGITKLAKLDFLIRYPSYFECAMGARGVKKEKIKLSDYERNTIEARMVRYRFGPWDHRYRRFLNILAVKKLIVISVNGRKISIDLTKSGLTVAQELSNKPEFSEMSLRADLLARYLNLSATNLMNFIYETFPELHNMEYNAEINAKSLAHDN